MPANSGQLVLLQDRSVVGGFHLSRAKTTGIIYSCSKNKDLKTNCKFWGLLMYILPQQLYYDMHTQYIYLPSRHHMGSSLPLPVTVPQFEMTFLLLRCQQTCPPPFSFSFLRETWPNVDLKLCASRELSFPALGKPPGYKVYSF